PSSSGLTASLPEIVQPNLGAPGATGSSTGSSAGSSPALPAGSGGTATTTESGVAFGGDTFLSEPPPRPVDADEEKSENNREADPVTPIDLNPLVRSTQPSTSELTPP